MQARRTFPVFISLVFSISLLLTSCAKEDHPNPAASEVGGLWYSILDQSGELSEAYGGGSYTRVIESILLREDGTGYGCTMFLGDEDGEPVCIYGGFDEMGLAPFSYTTSHNGRITLRFDNDNANEEYAEFFKKWSLSYADGVISCSDGSASFDMVPAEGTMESWLMSTYRNYVGGASADRYNINDADFNSASWRTQEAVYIYDGKGSDATDEKGRSGYKLVNLPWYKGTVQSNLPLGFCDEITPENGWEWVMNECGSRSIANNNFFALYNKYSGTLRFFFYMPEEFHTGNDHAWRVSLSDKLAQASRWPYGITSDRRLTDKIVLGQTDAGAFTECVTPWCKFKTSDGLIIPNAGWWAFDVDLSSYRHDADYSGETIGLQMLSWDVAHTSLYSAMSAGIDGTITAGLKLNDVTEKSTNTAKGVFAALSGLAHLGSSIAHFATGDFGNGFNQLGFVFSSGGELAGMYGKQNPQKLEGSLDGTISLGLSGSIDTRGIINQSKPTVGVASPTFSFDDFDTANTHLGQGSWNLKTPPVVYWCPELYMNWYVYNYITPYFFDPSSIELELNPNVFPQEKIEWMQVDAVCGARKSMMPSNDPVRRAYGLDGSTNLPVTYQYKDATNDFGGPLFNFLYAKENQYGIQGSHGLWSQYGDHRAEDPYIGGNGRDGYALEPMWRAERNTASIPFLEVCVTVTIKMTDMDGAIVMSRSYLPALRRYDEQAFEASYNRSRPYADKMAGHTELYDYQIERIADIFLYYRASSFLVPVKFDILGGIGMSRDYGYDRVLDGSGKTCWHANSYDKVDGVWYVEFKAKGGPFVPERYFLVTAGSASYNPKDWKLKAKLNPGDSWTTIATVNSDTRLPAEARQRIAYDLDVKGQQWQYFRMEISSSHATGSWNNPMWLAELDVE